MIKKKISKFDQMAVSNTFNNINGQLIFSIYVKYNEHIDTFLDKFKNVRDRAIVLLGLNDICPKDVEKVHATCIHGENFGDLRMP